MYAGFQRFELIPPAQIVWHNDEHGEGCIFPGPRDGPFPGPSQEQIFPPLPSNFIPAGWRRPALPHTIKAPAVDMVMLEVEGDTVRPA